MALMGFGIAFAFFLLVFLAVILVIEIFFLLNLQETLRRVSPENRRMTPGLVWLSIIPVIGWLWFIYVVIMVSDSLRAEFRSRGWNPVGDFGYGVGLATGILYLAGFAWRFIPGGVGAIAVLLAVGQLVCWIIYWTRIARYKNQLGPATWPGTMRPPYSGFGSQPPYGQPYGAQPYGGEPSGYGPPGYAPDDTPGGNTPPADNAPAGDTSAADAPEGEAGAGEDRSDRCPACNAPVKPGDRFCTVCGSPLP